MGQAIRMMKYDRAANLASAVCSTLKLNNSPLVFHKLDGKFVFSEQDSSLNDLQVVSYLIRFATIY